MPGILDTFLAGLDKLTESGALGAMGSHFLAAAGPQTDPTARYRLLAKGMQAGGQRMTRYAKELDDRKFRQAQLEEIQARTQERVRKTAAEAAAQRTLLGDHLTGAGPAAGSFRGAQEAGTTSPGALASAPAASQPFLRGLAAVDPKAAATAGLRLTEKGQPLTPEQETQKIRIARKSRAPVAQYSGQVFLDEQIGKYYQINPKTGAREYISPPQERFETVQAPYGRGGIGQRSTKSGKIVGYQKPEKTQERFEAAANPYGQGGVGQRSTKSGKIVGYQKPEKPIPQYSGRVDLDEQVGKFYQTNPKTGKREYISPNEEFLIEGGAQGGFRIRKGPAGAGGSVTKKTAGALEEKLLAAQEGLQRLKGIAGTYKQEFQEIPTRLSAFMTSLKSKTGLGDISPEDRQQLTDFADFRRGAIENINLYIKELTGAQMSEKEANRLRLAQPDPGEGIFSGDDPITFESKMNSAILASEKAIARFNYYRAKGITNVYEMASKSPLETLETATNPQTGERAVKIEGQWVPM